MYLDVLANAPLVFRTNAGTERMRITGAGNVGIGTPAPERWMHMAVAEPRIRMQDTAAVGSAATGFIEFHDSAGTRTGFVGDASSSNAHISIRSDNGSVLAVAGANTCTYTSGASWSCSSDARMKDSIEPLFDSLKKIVQLQGVTYRWRDPNKSEAVHVGLIAQDVRRVFPEVVTINDDDSMLQLDYAALVAPLVEAVKELKAANDTLKVESDALRIELRETIRSQDAEIEVLRRKIKAVAATR